MVSFTIYLVLMFVFILIQQIFISSTKILTEQLHLIVEREVAISETFCLSPNQIVTVEK